MFLGLEGRNPTKDFRVINEELKKYNEKLSTRKQIIVANKSDVLQDESLYNELEKVANENNIEIIKISAVTKEGVEELINHVGQTLKTLPVEETIEFSEERMIYKLEEKQEEFDVKIEKGVYLVTGNAIEKLLGRVNLSDNESMHFFMKMLKELGIEARLKEMGVQEGDIVKFVDWEFEWYE